MSATLSVTLGLDSTLSITLPSGRTVSVDPTEAGPTLLHLLQDHAHLPAANPAHPRWVPSEWRRLGEGQGKVRKFDARGQRQVTLADLGL